MIYAFFGGIFVGAVLGFILAALFCKWERKEKD